MERMTRKLGVAMLIGAMSLNSMATTQARGPFEALRPSTPIDRGEHPVLQKLLVGVGVIGLGIAAREMARQQGEHSVLGEVFGGGNPATGQPGALQPGAYLRYNSRSGLEYGVNF